MSRIGEIGGIRPLEFKSPTKMGKNPAKAEKHLKETIFHTKAFDSAFRGAMIADRIKRGGIPASGKQIPNLQSSGGNTNTTYRIGNPARPPIRHDNGFLQNPNNPNDPTPTATVRPSQADTDYYNDQLSQVKWAQRVDGLNVPFTDKDETARRLNDGIAAYRHFLEGNGADRNFSYDKFINEDPSGQTVLNNATTDLQRGVEDLYNQAITADPSLKDKPLTFNVTGGAITVGASDKFPYPETEDWQKSIGGHPIWTSGTVTVTPPATPGGKPQFSMNMTLHAEDRYNFNPGQADIATGVPDATRGKLEQTGLAHQYMQYGTSERHVTWSSGDIANTTNSTNQNNR